MSQVQFENSAFQCRLASYEKEHSYVLTDDQERLLTQVIIGQKKEAYDELGDSLRFGDDFVMTCITEAEANLPFMSARILAGAVTECLLKRYMGDCGAAGSCSGRADMDARLAALFVPVTEDIDQSFTGQIY